MEQYSLYANFYDWDQEMGEEGHGKYLYVYKGIYHIQSTHGGVMYPVLKHIGSVDLIGRRFIKAAKHARKIYKQNGNSVCTHSKANNVETTAHEIERNTYAPIREVLLQNNYADDFITEIINTINTTCDDKSIPVNNHNIVGGELRGIVPF